jgi:serine/threonine protein kinase
MNAAIAMLEQDGHDDQDGPEGHARPDGLERPDGQVIWEDLVPGALVGDAYRIVRRIARGGMGDIYLTTHERLHSQFVLKVPSPESACDAAAVARFRHEAELMIAARHPNVVQVVDFNVTELGLPYLVMEYLPGQDLAQVLAARGPLEASEIASIVRQVASALDAAHSRGIVHRDLKPENIMVVPCPGQPDLVKVIDFGISKARQIRDTSEDGVLVGTPEFMSPEQIQYRRCEVDGRSDQFSLAVIVYLLLTGRTPWGTSDPLEALERVVHDQPLPLVGDFHWRWHSVETVLSRGMAHSAAQRFDTILAFAQALERAMTNDGLLPAGVVTRGQGQPRLTHRDGHRDTHGDAHGDDGWATSGKHRLVLSTSGGGARALRVVTIGQGSSAANDVGPAGAAPTTPAQMDGYADENDDADDARTRPGRRSGGGRARAFGWDGILVLAAVFCAVWLGRIDVPTVRQGAGSGWQSVEHVVDTSLAVASAGSGYVRRVWSDTLSDLSPTAGY